MATEIPENFASFSIAELLSHTAGELLFGSPEGLVCGVTTDTRADLSGKVFVALEGERFDAHDYLGVAAQRGAATLIVRPCEKTHRFVETLCDYGANAPQIIAVASTLVALGDLSAAHRRRWGGRLVAIAGSAGKTTTRAATSALCEAAFPGEVHSTRGNLNNRIGVPMTLLGLLPKHRFCILEIGTNCPGEVATLSSIARPNVGVLTLVDLEHTEGLGDLDGVQEEERQLFSFMDPAGCAVGFGEDERVLACVESAPVAQRKTYGFDEGRTLRIAARKTLRPELMEVILRRDGSELCFTSSLIGRPGALAVSAAVVATETLSGIQVTSAQCNQAFSELKQAGRNNLIELAGPRYVIDDTYNSNPASVQNSIATARELAQEVQGRLWLVLGEMLELGRLSAECHRAMGTSAARSGAVGAYFVQGDAVLSAEVAASSMQVCEFMKDSGQVVAELAPRIAPGDVVLVKASRGVRAERVVEGLGARFGPRKDLGAPHES